MVKRRKKNPPYEGQSDHDLLVSLNTWKDIHSKNVEKTFVELKNRDDKLDVRISDCYDTTETKVENVRRRVNKIKWISPITGIIGGFFGAIASIFINKQ